LEIVKQERAGRIWHSYLKDFTTLNPHEDKRHQHDHDILHQVKVMMKRTQRVKNQRDTYHKKICG
jgi:hypothetical protein